MMMKHVVMIMDINMGEMDTLMEPKIGINVFQVKKIML